MIKNMGSTDRIIRVLAAIVIAALFFSNVVGGVFGTLLLLLAAVFILTSLFGTCPLYLPFGISSCKVKKTTE